MRSRRSHIALTAIIALGAGVTIWLTLRCLPEEPSRQIPTMEAPRSISWPVLTRLSSLVRSAPPLPPPGPGWVEGVVIDQDGAPVASATVVVEGPKAKHRQEFVSDRSGRFAFLAQSSLPLSVRASKAGALGQAKVSSFSEIVVRLDGCRRPLSLKIAGAPSDLMLSRVSNRDLGARSPARPVPQPDAVDTCGEGVLVFSGSGVADGFWLASSLVDSGELVLGEGHAVDVHIKDGPNCGRDQRVEFRAQDFRLGGTWLKVLDADSRDFTVTGLAAGCYDVSIDGGICAWNDVVCVGNGGAAIEADLRTCSYGIRVDVTSLQGSEADIEVVAGLETASTDASGQVEFPCVRSARLGVVGHEILVGDPSVPPGEGWRELTLVVIPGQWIKGMVLADGQPYPGAAVYLAGMISSGSSPMATESTTDREGRFRFRVEPGVATIRATGAGGLASLPEAVRIEPDRDPPFLTIELDESASVEVQVVDLSGEPLPGVEVVLAPFAEDRMERFGAQTDSIGPLMIKFLIGERRLRETHSSGGAHFSGILPGRYSVAVDGCDVGRGRDITLKEADHRLLRTTCPSTPVRLEGRLIRDGGDGVASIEIVARSTRQKLRTRSDEQGRFSFERLIDQNYVLRLADPATGETVEVPMDVSDRNVLVQLEHE